MNRVWQIAMHTLFPSCRYMGRNVYDIRNDGQVFPENPDHDPAARMVILGKHTYFETVGEFPFGNLKEIRAAITMDPAAYSPFATRLFFVRRIGVRDDKTLVNLWFVRPEIVSELEQVGPWLIFPETALWCLGAQTDNGLYIISQPDGYLLVHYMNGMIHSTLAKNDDSDLSTFRRSMGKDISQTETIRTNDFHTYLNDLRAAVPTVSLSDMALFFSPGFQSGQIDQRMLRRGLASLGLMAVLDASVWAGMPMYIRHQLMQENETVSANLGDILDKQAKTDESVKEIGLLAQTLNDYTPRMMLLNMLFDILPGDTVITQMTLAGNRVEIRGSAGQASMVLTSLAAGQGVEQAQFSAPLRKDSKTGRELFAVSFGYGRPGQPGHADK